MGTFQGEDVCLGCGEIFLYDFDCRTGEYSKVSMCACDRFSWHAEKFLKEKGLWEEFEKYHKKLEAERESEQ